MTEHDKFVTPEMVARLQTGMKRDPQETFSMSYVRDNYLASRVTIDQAACFEAGWDAAIGYAHANAAQSNSWQPIETAPKDGRSFIGWANHLIEPSVFAWSPRRKQWMATHNNEDVIEYQSSFGTDYIYESPDMLTQWRPLPPPPSKPKDNSI